MAAEFDLADLKIEDTNLAGVGSEEDKACRKQAAQQEEAWKGCGAAPGVEVWRIEQFKVVPWPKAEYGNFYEGDSYIVLRTTKDPDGEKLLWNIFFWLGLKSTADEQGTAAYKTVELDDLFDGAPIQHREVMMHESAEFKSMFTKISYLTGGVESGFRHVETGGAYVPKLLLVKRLASKIHVVQVPTARDSLNHGDAFVLDAGARVYAWFGSEASPFEKQAANTLAENLENERAGAAKATTDVDDAFWETLGGPGDIKPAGQEPTLPQAMPVGEGVLYKLSDESGELKCSEVGRGDLSKGQLDSGNVYICDPGPQLLVWVGAGASDREYRTALITATRYLKCNGKPVTTPVAMMSEGQPMPAPFNAIFSN